VGPLVQVGGLGSLSVQYDRDMRQLVWKKRNAWI